MLRSKSKLNRRLYKLSDTNRENENKEVSTNKTEEIPESSVNQLIKDLVYNNSPQVQADKQMYEYRSNIGEVPAELNGSEDKSKIVIDSDIVIDSNKEDQTEEMEKIEENISIQDSQGYMTISLDNNEENKKEETLEDSINEMSIDREIGEVNKENTEIQDSLDEIVVDNDKNEIVDNQELMKFKQQFEDDFQEFDILQDQYNEWFKRSKDLPEKIKECLKLVSNIVEEFGSEYKELQNAFIEDNNKRFYEGKSKGVFMVSRMLSNVLNVNCTEFCNISLIDIPTLIKFDEIREKTLEEIQNAANVNYNNICTVRNKRDQLIKNYFKFINVYLLNIIDGIKSGIDYSNSDKEDDEIILRIENVYERLLEKIEDLLKSLDISRIDVKRFDPYNYVIHQIFDVQQTKYAIFNEKVYEVTKYGYVYKDMIYNEDHKHIVRPAEVIVYKYTAK